MTPDDPSQPKEQVDLIQGEWVQPAETLDAMLKDPNTGADLQRQLATAAADVERAIAAAYELHLSGVWEREGLGARAALLERLAEGLDSRAEEIGREDALATGNPLGVAVQMATYLGPRVRAARSQLLEIGTSRNLNDYPRPVRLLRRAIGPAVVLAPWNAPSFVGVAKVASALAAGCPVILKPSEWAPGGCQVVAEVLLEAAAGLPPAIFQLVHGAAGVGAQLVSDPRIRAVSFTGGGTGGRAVALAAAPHFGAVQLELGGHNPAVVLADADVEVTAEALVDGMTKLNGQWCEGPGKVLVHEDLHDAVIDAVLERLGRLTVGHCLEKGTDVGPLSHEPHLNLLNSRIERIVAAGGEALSVNELPDLGGWFMAPTLVVGADPAASTGELFGPAVSVHRMTSDEAAIAAAAGPETGLAGFVFGSDVEQALAAAARIPAGEVRVNGCKLADLADDSEQSFWNAAGVGGHGPTDTVRFFQLSQVVGVEDPGLPI
ncbi:aldehyde dehydrogenase family protein [Nocardioides aurantiacus]|uniref:aldehyde dehydrogenase family protein n=1 Tax=Nocardioides aurantiacus TaxID=86796 RepID=UPI00403F9070